MTTTEPTWVLTQVTDPNGQPETDTDTAARVASAALGVEWAAAEQQEPGVFHLGTDQATALALLDERSGIELDVEQGDRGRFWTVYVPPMPE